MPFLAQEILPHPRHADQRIVMLQVERAAKDFGEEPIVSFVGTDGSEDRHGSRINPSGWELEAYRANPVVLYGHDQHHIAVGKTVSLVKAGGAWEFDIRFLVDEWKDYGGPNVPQLLLRVVKAGVMATSVSFIPKEWRELEAKQIPSFFAENVEYTRQELTEISIVNVPSNRNAVKKALGENVISENEATFLGLGQMFRFEMPMMLRTDAGVIAPADAVATPDSANEDRDVPAGPPADVPADAPPETPTVTEQQLMASMIESIWALAQEGMQGFDASEHDSFRMFCAGVVADSLYRVDTLKYWLDHWFVPEAGQPMMMAAPELEARVRDFVASQRAGAVLNKTNKTNLTQAQALIQEVLDSATSDTSNAAPESATRDEAPAVVEFNPDDLARSFSNLFGTSGSGNPDESHNPGAEDTRGGSDAPESTKPNSYLFRLLQ